MPIFRGTCNATSVIVHYLRYFPRQRNVSWNGIQQLFNITLPVISQLHHFNNDFIGLGILPRQNDRQLPKHRDPENHLGAALWNPGGTAGRSEGELLIDPIQERRREIRLTWRPTSSRRLHYRGTGNLVRHPARSRPTHHLIGDKQRRLGKPPPRPCVSGERIQRMEKPWACRGKENRGGSQKNISSRSIQSQSGIHPSPGEGNRHTPLHG